MPPFPKNEFILSNSADSLRQNQNLFQEKPLNLPPTELTSPFQTVICQGFARKGAAGPGIGHCTTHFSGKDGGGKGGVVQLKTCHLVDIELAFYK
jgi:hypothetical protein